MIHTDDPNIQNQRRIFAQQHGVAERPRSVLLARALSDVFNVSFFYGDTKEFWNAWSGNSPSTQMNTIKDSAKLLGAKTIQELIETHYLALCKAEPMTVRAMAFLLDFCAAFGLEIVGAPGIPPRLTRKAASA